MWVKGCWYWSEEKQLEIKKKDTILFIYLFIYLLIYLLIYLFIELANRLVVGLHGVDPLSYFSFKPVLHDWFNKGRGMYYPVCEMMHIKEPLLLVGKSSPCGTLPYVWRHITVK